MTHERLENFGRNLLLQPQVICRPTTESEVLQVLDDYRGRRIRAIGKLHSWSAAPQTNDVLVDLSKLRRVDVEEDGGVIANIGAGCQIKRLLNKLDRRKLTLPAVGLVSEQTIAGAIATATHGSGRHSLSYYVHSLRIACYHPETGAPMIRPVQAGAEMQAARCGLGCLGLVLSVEIKPRPQYNVEQWFTWHNDLAEVMAAETDAPLMQFFYIPWKDCFLAQQRKETAAKRSWFATLYRAYWFLTIDVGLHFTLCLLAQVIKSTALIKWFFRYIAALFLPPSALHVVGKSQTMLIMEHELFRHIEIELFVKQSNLPAAMEFIRGAIKAFDRGDRSQLPASALEQLGNQLAESWPAESEKYTHHYPVCVRKVLPDDAFLSMSGGGEEPYYALSFISYQRRKDRASFFRFAEFLAHSMARLFDARCHWGKVNPQSAAEIARLYPKLPQFQEVCRRFDAAGAFQNDWTEEVVMGKPVIAKPS